MTEINVTFDGEAADRIISLADGLGLTCNEVVKCLISEGIKDKWCKDIVRDTLSEYERIYRHNAMTLVDTYCDLLKKQETGLDVELDKRKVLDESLAYDTRIEALKDVKDCLKVRGVFT